MKAKSVLSSKLTSYLNQAFLFAVFYLSQLDGYTSKQGSLHDYCQWETFDASCHHGDIVVMTSARFGRMRVGTCVKQSYDTVGCAANVMTYSDSLCSGRQSCTIKVPDIPSQGIRPCPEDLTSYFEASYTCIPVVASSPHSCVQDHFLPVPTPSGYIWSHTERVACPWRVRAQLGQLINLTLFDFTMTSPPSGSGGVTPLCRKYAGLNEPFGGNVRGQEVPICGGNPITSRERHIYLSDSHVVDIRIITGNQQNNPRFLIKYEIVGCADYKLPAGAKSERTGDKLTVTCNSTGHRWHLRCNKNSWVGDDSIKCPAENSSGGLWNILTGNWTSPTGLIMVVTIGVALGIVIGVCLLGIALVWLRRKRILRKNSDSSAATQMSPPVPTYGTGLQPPDGEYSTVWQSQRPLPVSGNEDQFASNKQCNLGNLGTVKESMDVIVRGDGTCISIPPCHFGSQHHTYSHVYESPKFLRHESGHLES